MHCDDEWLMSPDMSLIDRSAALPKTLIQEEWQINPLIVILGQRPTKVLNSGFCVLTCAMLRWLRWSC